MTTSASEPTSQKNPDSQTPAETQPTLSPRTKTIVGTIGLSIVCSALWELVARPGLGWFGRSAFTVITFGSGRLRDLVYETAALDGSPLPGLVLLTAVSFIPLYAGYFIWLRVFGRPRIEETTRRDSRAVFAAAVERGDDPHYALKAHQQQEVQSARRNVRVWTNIGIVYFALVWVAALGFSQGVSNAVWVRRAFMRNLAACGPYLSEQEEKVFLSRFAQMHTKAEHDRIAADLESIAKQHGVSFVKT